MITPQTKLSTIPKILPKYAKLLEKLELRTVEDLLFYFPFRYDDFSKTVPISQDYLGQTVTVHGKIIKSKLTRIFRRRMSIVEIIIQDDNSIPLKAVWFNQPYIAENLKEGIEVRLSGKIISHPVKSRKAGTRSSELFDGASKKYLSMSNPAWERSARETTNTGAIIPVYSETRGLTSKWLRWQIKPLLLMAKQLEDPLPFKIRTKLNLYDLYTALHQIHFPESEEKLIRAQKRFAFQEMFLVQLKTLQVRSSWAKEKATAIKFDEKLIKNFVAKLPFQLTNAQRKASFEILKDIEKPKPMNRLLNGDVGSGKTIVAAISALQVLDSNFQIALMAPTEVLARQHYLTFCELLKNCDINIALLTNSYQEIKNSKFNPPAGGQKLKSSPSKKANRDKLIQEIRNGNVNLVIGTHALIQKDINFHNLALIIIDEQHRFGVAQRAYLQQKIEEISDGIANKIPHLLSMTATPIPRTLALTLFGSLDLSLLDEMPKNRKPIITKIVSPSGREKVYEFIRSEIKKGQQIFVILPLVEESKILTEVKAATAEHARLSKDIFPELKLGLLHGKLKAKEKEMVMQDFKDKKTQILVATAVVEVGIDIPNATVMIIEDADRFGLSQLHQFRGRVGRSNLQSYCFLFSTSDTQNSKARLKALEENTDGFKIAEKDLELRGPGQFLGTIQSGLPDIAMENLTNVKLIKISQEEAKNILREDITLQNYPALSEALQKFNEKIHLE